MKLFNDRLYDWKTWTKLISSCLVLILLTGQNVLAVRNLELSYISKTVNPSEMMDKNISGSDFQVTKTVNHMGLAINQDSKVFVPPTIAFGKVIKDESKTVPFKISNIWQVNIKVDSMIFTGADAAEFKISSPKFPVTINSGTDLTIEAVFNPKKVGIKDVKLFIYSDNILMSGEVSVSAESYVEGSQINNVISLNKIPADYALQQNYPNPFNPSTIIQYSVPENNFISINVYNIAGQLIETLVKGYHRAGTYKIEWNAGSISTGFYFYKMETGKISIVKKMLLVK
jgi:hypothetical protein